MQSKKMSRFDPAGFLSQAGLGRKIMNVQKKGTIFTQGDRANSVFYIQKGRVRLTVVSARGKEATLALLGPEIFSARSALPACNHLA
jgi:CRP/FNR family transcriptional regulator, cyclic AMP receptor protein